MKRLSVPLVLLVFGLLAGCSSSSSPTLTTIQISPASASIAKGQQQTFTVQGMFSNGTTQNLTSQVTWASSSNAIATVTNAGIATGAGQGSATISATMSGVTGTAALQVTPAILTSIAVSPATPTLSPGMFQQFTATGTYSDGSTQDLTSTATWSSSAENLATITSTGYLTAREVGTPPSTSIITASSGSINGTTTLTVAPPTLTSIVIPDGNLSIAVGTSHAFRAFGIYSDGGQRAIADMVTWASTQPTVAAFLVPGSATGVAPGTSSISASLGSVSQSVTLTVTNATVNTIAIAPSNTTIELGTKRAFTAVGVFSDTSTQIITPFATWGSSNTGVATFSTQPQLGVATAQGPGTTTVSASTMGATGSVQLIVNPATLTGLTLPTSGNMAVGSTFNFRVTAQYNDGSSVPVGTATNWQSSDPTIASINSIGTITGVAPGTVTITAIFEGMSATASLTVENLSSIAVTPSTQNVAPGTFVRLTATGTLSDGTSTQDLTPSVTWTSSSPAVGLMSNVPGTFGGAIGLTPGTSTIGAVLDGVVGSSQVTVTSATLSSITLTPLNPSIVLGTDQQFKAVGNFSDGSNETLTDQVTWTSSDVGVAITDINGAATSSGTGSTTITTTMGSTSTNTTLTVH